MSTSANDVLRSAQNTQNSLHPRFLHSLDYVATIYEHKQENPVILDSECNLSFITVSM